MDSFTRTTFSRPNGIELLVSLSCHELNAVAGQTVNRKNFRRVNKINVREPHG
jgi:hypothetical protein